MACPLTKAESVDDKLNKTGERLLTELGILRMSQVKAEMQFGKGQTELFLSLCSLKVVTGVCQQMINGRFVMNWAPLYFKQIKQHQEDF